MEHGGTSRTKLRGFCIWQWGVRRLMMRSETPWRNPSAAPVFPLSRPCTKTSLAASTPRSLPPASPRSSTPGKTRRTGARRSPTVSAPGSPPRPVFHCGSKLSPGCPDQSASLPASPFKHFRRLQVAVIPVHQFLPDQVNCPWYVSRAVIHVRQPVKLPFGSAGPATSPRRHWNPYPAPAKRPPV